MPPDHNAPHAILAERLFDGQGWRDKAAVLIEAGCVRAVSAWHEIPEAVERHQVPDGGFVTAGFIDLQVNGGGGILLNDRPTAETMREIARVHRRFGTTGLLPTFITDSRDKTLAAIAAARACTGSDGVLGLHVEGPFINPVRAGIHRKENVARAQMNDIAWLAPLGEIGRSIVTLAPECVPPGFIRELASCGIRVCAGHTEASASVLQNAIEEGLSGVTHLFNAMPPFGSRAPGPVGTTFADGRLTAGLIVDGFHVDPVSVRAAFAAKGAARIALVTDAMPTVGADIDAFELPGTRIARRNGRLVSEDGTLAGAHLDMASAVRNAVQLANIPLEQALVAASRTPARFLGLGQERGVIAPGARADLVALTKDLEVIHTWLGGVPQHAA
ncbi:MAG: N-acetylglucosamine-6-phosphate deacetylase [Alphaproteobacteria bacterium]|nr:N-acetylglucosamine-6-phosphate deacetylase [Alphaproteobacteria bacterium]